MCCVINVLKAFRIYKMNPESSWTQVVKKILAKPWHSTLFLIYHSTSNRVSCFPDLIVTEEMLLKKDKITPEDVLKLPKITESKYFIFFIHSGWKMPEYKQVNMK